jgi:hypothetical protein
MRKPYQHHALRAFLLAALLVQGLKHFLYAVVDRKPRHRCRIQSMRRCSQSDQETEAIQKQEDDQDADQRGA